MSSNNIPLLIKYGLRDDLARTPITNPGIIYYCYDTNELFFDFTIGTKIVRQCLNPYITDPDYGTPVFEQGKGLINQIDKDIIDTAVRFVEQNLEPQYKWYARQNIDAVGEKTAQGGEIFNRYPGNPKDPIQASANLATGLYSHAEGDLTIAKGYSSHAEGGIYGASSSNPDGYAHTITASDYPTFLAEDVTIYGSIANGNNSHAEGGGTYAHSEGSHAEGAFTLAMGYGSHSEGYGTQATGYVSHAEGYETKATQQAAHAEGDKTKATANSAHAEGRETKASGDYAHAEGNNTTASGTQSHAEGYLTKATASCAHAEGYGTEVTGGYSHAEGYYSKAKGQYSHAEGYYTEVNGDEAHAEGFYSQANGNYSHAEGYETKATTDGAHAEGHGSEASGSYAHAEGFDTQASGFVTHAEGCYTHAIGQYSHAEGERTEAQGEASHAEGSHRTESRDDVSWSISVDDYSDFIGEDLTINGPKAIGIGAHAEGISTLAFGEGSHSEGYKTLAMGTYSHAKNYKAQALGTYSSAEGSSTIASGDVSHAEGEETKASGYGAHAEGSLTKASGSCSHAEGEKTTASKYTTHAEGCETEASGEMSHAEGYRTLSTGNYSHAEGKNTQTIGKGSHAEGSMGVAFGDYSHVEGQGFDYPINLIGSGPTYEIQDVEFPGGEDWIVLDPFVFFNLSAGTILKYIHPTEGIKYCYVSEVDLENEIITLSSTGTYEKIIEDGQYLITSQAAYEYTFYIPDPASEINPTMYITSIANVGAHVEGIETMALGTGSHSEGYHTKATQLTSHAEGCKTIASSKGAHAEGEKTVASRPSAHAEGYYTKANGFYSHAEGNGTIAQGYAAHAEGYEAQALGDGSHAEGDCTKAQGHYSHAEGYKTIASGRDQHVQGKYNIEDTENKYAHIVGNGHSTKDSNAHTLDWEGNAWFAGDIYIGGTSMDDATKLEAAKPRMTKVTLTTSGWNTTNLTQSVTIMGILEDETAQAIYINPVFNDTMIEEIGNCNVYASTQSENSITFSCDSIPTIDVEFYVKWQDVTWFEDPTSTTINPSVMSVEGVEF